MNSCLGIYVGDKVLKYAKLVYDDKAKSIQVDSCGVKQVVGEKAEAIHNIVDITGSASIPIAVNVTNAIYSSVDVHKSLKRPETMSVVELEVFELADEMKINEKLLTYRYLPMTSDRTETSNKHVIATIERVKLDEFEKQNRIKTSGVYPLNFVLNRIVDKSLSDYVYINIDETTDVICVAQGEVRDIETLPIGIKDILDEIARYCGSTSKAYELCKSVNLYTEQTGVNDPEIEKIVEPVLQDLLHRVEEKIKSLKYVPNKLLIGGMGTLFTNIDMLFEEYFSISANVVKPYFVREDNEAISDIVETTEAIALAHEYLIPGKYDLNFVNKKSHKKMAMNSSAKEKSSSVDVDTNKVISGLLFANIIMGVIAILYIVFSILYSTQINKMEKQLGIDVAKTKGEITKVQQDIDYIKQNTKKYSDINDFVEETVRKIEGNEIGKYSTYNVANFMQKIIKYIPKGVELETVSSDDNKHVTIVAKSESYSGLGYFISQIKLKGILENVEVDKVEHTSYVIVTIGGDLP